MYYLPKYLLRHLFQDLQSVYQQQGLNGLLHQLPGYIRYREFRTIKLGTYKGTDPGGNEYYENLSPISGMARWVLYKDPKDYDGSDCWPGYNQWIHFVSDRTPDTEPEYFPTYKCK